MAQPSASVQSGTITHSLTHSRLNQACLFALQIVQAKDSVTQMSYQLDMVRRLRNRSLANGGMCLGWARDGLGWDGLDRLAHRSAAAVLRVGTFMPFH